MIATKTKIYTLAAGAIGMAAITVAWYMMVLHHPKGIQAPIEALDVPFETVAFNAEDGLELVYKTGSTINIPPNSLVDADGNPISGSVTAQYREFHSAMDIFRAGVPMGDVATGQALMSGGMFELNVTQGDEELALASGKQANLALAAYRPTEGYNVFALDGEGAWQQNGLPKLDTNQAKIDGLAGLKPLPPKPIDPRAGESDIIIDLEANYTEYPDLKFFGNTRWRMVPQENPGFQDNLWAFRVIWSRMKIVKHDPARNLYKLEMKQRQQTYSDKVVQREYSLIVAPVLEGNDLEASLAAFNKAMEQYDSVAVYIIQERDRLEAQADVLNSFNIESFGVHNIDQIIRDDLMVSVEASFNFTDEVNPYFTKIRVYLLNHDLNTVQDYGVTEWDFVFVQPQSNTTVIAVLPNNQVAILYGDDFARLPLQNHKGKPYRFNMSIVPQEQLVPLMGGLTAMR